MADTRWDPSGSNHLLVNETFPISSLRFNLTGTLLATTSSHENLIQIFKVDGRKKIATLEPSISEQIIDVQFCSQTSYVCCLILNEVKIP